MNKTSRSITLWPFPTLTFLFKQMTAACLPHNNFREWLVVNVVHNCTSNFLSSVASNLCITCNYTNSTYFVVCRQWLQMDCVEQTTLALSWGRHSLIASWCLSFSFIYMINMTGSVTTHPPLPVTTGKAVDGCMDACKFMHAVISCWPQVWDLPQLRVSPRRSLPVE